MARTSRVWTYSFFLPDFLVALFLLNSVLLGMSVTVSCPSLTKSWMWDPYWENDTFLLDFSWCVWGSMDLKAAWRLAVETWMESAFYQFPRGGFLEVVCLGRVLKGSRRKGGIGRHSGKGRKRKTQKLQWGERWGNEYGKHLGAGWGHISTSHCMAIDELQMLIQEKRNPHYCCEKELT